MGYNAENYRRIRAEFENKYLHAREQADRRRSELHEKVAGVREIDEKLGKVGLEIMGAIVGGADGVRGKVEKIRRRNMELQKQRAQLLKANGYPEDYSDVRYECPICSDTGYVDGKMCSCMKKALVMAGCESSGMGMLLKTQNFENFSLSYYRGSAAEQTEMEKNVNIAYQYADNFSGVGSGNLLLMGGTGLGKTHLCSAMARVIIERGYDVYYACALNIISDFEYQRFGNGMPNADKENTGRYFDCDLLIIDDLGTEVTNQFTVSCLFNIINTRLNSGRSTVINTNLTPAELRSRYTDRIVSRLLGEYIMMHFVGRDVRSQKLERQNGK